MQRLGLLVAFTVAWLLTWQALTLLPVHAAGPDPKINYLYGTSYDQCAAGDYHTAEVTANSNNIHCIHFSSDSSTYITGPTDGDNCLRQMSPFAAEGGFQYDSKNFGILCVYFKDGTSQIKSGTLDFGGSDSGSFGTVNTGDPQVHGDQCGKGSNVVSLSISVGCRGSSYGGPQLNPIVDMLFAFIRFMSVGVGLVVIVSIIIAGIQYTASQGNPQATAAAIKRITNTGGALLLYLLAFALLNWLVPGGLFF